MDNRRFYCSIVCRMPAWFLLFTLLQIQGDIQYQVSEKAMSRWRGMAISLPHLTPTFKVHSFLLFAMETITKLQYSNCRQLYTNKTNATIDLKGGTPISGAWRASLIQVIWEGNKSILNLTSPNSLLSYKIFSFSFFTLLLWFPTYTGILWETHI